MKEYQTTLSLLCLTIAGLWMNLIFIFFGLSEELIQAISKLSIEYTLDNKYLIEQYRNEKGIVQYDDRKQ